MLPEIKKVLYATDLSPNSVYVLRHAVNSALKHNASITILHVVEPIASTAQVVISSYMNDLQLQALSKEKSEQLMERIMKRIETFCEKELGNDPQLKDRIESIEISEGFPPDEILRQADLLNCDVIVMGTHAKGFLENAFLGSTARRILRRTRKPVFVVPLPAEISDEAFADV